jgi:uncharacterized protein YciI
MLYAIICEELPGALERRLANRPAHVARLKELQAEGRLLLAGPHPEDPYCLANVFSRVTVKPFKKTLPA